VQQSFARHLPLLATCLTLLMPAGAAQGRDAFDVAGGLTADLAQGKRLFGYCIECHGAEGWGLAARAIPQIAGQHRSVIIKQLADIRAGNRDVTPMLPYAREALLGGAQGIADIAGYVAALPMTPTPSRGRGENLGRARAIYRTRCAQLCHGEDGEGHFRKRKPRIQGQHYEYLLRQLMLIRDGRRKNANRAMVRRLYALTDADLATLADYISRLAPSAELVAPLGWSNPDFPAYGSRPPLRAPGLWP